MKLKTNKTRSSAIKLKCWLKYIANYFIKNLLPKRNRKLQTIKTKQGKNLLKEDEIMERWAEYVKELYKNENRGETVMDDLTNEVLYCTNSSEEIGELSARIYQNKRQSKISEKLLQGMEGKGIEIMTSLINKVNKTGYIPEDLRKSIHLYRCQKSVERWSVVT